MPSDTRRDARTSRDSDAAGTTTPRGQDKEKTKSKSMNGTLDGWVEPSLAAKPSFEDHGGAPYGVLEHMQPLGEPPSTRVRARVKGDGARKSLLGKGGAGAGLDAQETPEGTPGPQSSQAAMEALPPLPPIAMDDSDDDDYAPGKKSKKKEKVAKPRAQKRQSEAAGSSAEGPASGKGKGRGKKVVEKAPKAVEQPPQVVEKPLPPPPPPARRIYYGEKLKSVVDEARMRAIESGKKSLADAVQEIHLQSLTNDRLATLLEAILCQNATPEQTTEFQGYVKQAKKKLRLAKTEGARKSSTAEVNGKKPLPVRAPLKEETVTQVKQELPAVPVTEKAAIPKPKFSIKVKSPAQQQTSSNRTSHTHATSSSPVKHKTEDMDNDSDLSELTELSEGEDMAADTPEERDEMSAGPPHLSNGTKGKDQAAERGSLGVQGGNLKRSSADAEIQETEDDRVLSAKKLKLSGNVTREYDYTDSHIRSSLSGLPRGARGPGAKNGAASTPRITLHPNGGGNASARSSRAISLDAESPLSSPAGSSRRSTPGHVWKGPPKQTGKRAKTKTSPEKKQQHPSYAGMPGAGGAGRDSPIGEDDNEELSENNDFCSSCGGAGFLLCCDGCDRAFHFTCLDPPIKDEASELNEPWFCFICVAKRPVSTEQPEKPARGIFAPLLNSLNKKNPETFALPEYIRNYFEGVATAKNGEFTEAVKPKTRRGGYDERPDDYKLKDTKGNSVICYACHKSSLGKRVIITCDYCGQHWHTDCLDPPLANPPCRDPNGVKTSDWMCPLHVDHELRQVDTRLLKPARLSRRVHIRKPRQAKTMETALQRGLQNNGIIEIADDDSDETDSEFYEDDRDPTTVFKMPAQGIKLDFIDRVKQTRIQDYHERQRLERLHKRIKLDNATNAPGVLSQPNFTRHSIREQQTALSLAQFANANPDLDLGSDRVENLVGALIAEAPEQVIDDIAAGEGQNTTHTNGIKASPSPPNSQQHNTKNDPLSPEQRKELELLQELIKRKLQGS